MFIIRPVTAADAGKLYEISHETGRGFTSLRPDKKFIEKKINLVLESFANYQNIDDRSALYFFAMEDTKTRDLIGTAAIKSGVGKKKPWYSFKISKQVHSCSKLDVYNATNILLLCSDHTGCSELCSLFLRPKYRNKVYGTPLSKFRFMFIKANNKLFSTRVIAELRGFLDDKGLSPFWEDFVCKFLPMSFEEADHLSTSDKSFIAELMPRHPIYTNLLSNKMRDIIGKTHGETIPAAKILKREGFNFNNYIDIFDGGPLLECYSNQILSINNTVKYKVVISNKVNNQHASHKWLVANSKVIDFRCTMTRDIEISSYENKVVTINTELADTLLLSEGDYIYLLNLI